MRNGSEKANLQARLNGWFGVTAIAVALSPVTAFGQRADTLSARAIADTQSVVAELTREIAKNRRDAAMWFRLGSAAWVLHDRARAPNPPRGLDATRLGRMADSCLRIAAELAPDNVTYQLATGDFLLASGVPSARTASAKYYEAALTAGRKSGDPAVHARTALEYGRVAWRRFESLVNRRMSTNIGDIGRSLSDAMQPIAKGAAQMEELAARDREAETLALIARASGKAVMFTASAPPADIRDAMSQKGATGAPPPALTQPSTGITNSPGISLGSVRNIIETTTFPLPPNVSGAQDFARADSLFTEALLADPESRPAFRAATMPLLEKENWSALEELARKHLDIQRSNPQVWGALGLALHRQGRSIEAAQVFDTSMMAYDPESQRRLDSPARVLPPTRGERADATWRTNGDLVSRIYWLSADPLWGDGIPERRAEFRARVAYAELRWTVEEANIRGANTDRGDIYIRYGPPDMIAVFGPHMMDNAQDIMTFWIYDSGLMFAFSGFAGFSTSRIPAADRPMIDALKESQPVRFDNLADPRPDSMVVRTARFRASPDSVDVYIAVLPPVTQIRESSAAGAARADVWFMLANGRIAARESFPLDGDGVYGWASRVPAANFLFRVEASGPQSKRTARASAQLDGVAGMPLQGPGISDVIMAADATDGGGTAKRWRDFTITPSVGPLLEGGSVALVWENYDFGARDGSAQYSVSISLVPQRSAAGKIVAGITGALASIARVETREDRTVIQYDRSAPAAPVLPELIKIDLGATPTGTYSVVVEVTDKVRGTTFTRNTDFTLRGK